AVADGHAREDHDVGADPAVVADDHVAVGAAVSGDMGGFLDLGGEGEATDPVRAMVAAEVDLDAGGNRGVGADAERRAFVPVVYLRLAVGARPETVVRVAILQALGFPVELREFADLAPLCALAEFQELLEHGAPLGLCSR